MVFLYFRRIRRTSYSAALAVILKKYLKIHLMIILVLSTLGFGQDFELIEVEKIMEKDTIGDFPIYETYHLNDYCFAIGTDPRSNNQHDLRLFVFDPKSNLIYRSDGQADSMTFTLKFFKSKNKPNLHLIFAHSSNEYSWGNEVFRFENGQIEYLGLLDIATYDQFDVPWDISTFMEIHKNGQNLRFEFTKDTLILNPGGKKEKMVKSKNVLYLWDGQKMELINNR